MPAARAKAAQLISRSCWGPVAHHDLRDRAGDVLLEVFRRWSPVACRLFGDTDRLRDPLGIGSAEDRASAFDRFGALGRVADRDAGNAKDAALLLHRSAVADDAQRLA